MKAAVFHKPGKITCDIVEDPRIELATLYIHLEFLQDRKY